MGLGVKFEHFEHGADVGVRGFGTSPAEAFEAAAQALFTLFAENLGNVQPQVEQGFTLEAEGLEELFVAFLNELIWLAATRGLVFGRFEVRIEGGPPGPYRLRARAWGEPFDASRHESTVEPKGATYTALRVEEEDGRWVAQCVVDV